MLERHRKERKVSTKARVYRVALLLLAYAVRAVFMDAQGLWRDEVDQWRFALQPWGEMLQNFTRPGWNGPLYSPMLRAWIALTGESAYAMRTFSLLWGVVCVALVYVLVKRLADGGAAGWAALLMTMSPYMVWYAQEVKMYTWVPMLALLALYALDRACEDARACARPRWFWWLVVLLATSLAFYSHILAALLIPVEFVWFWLHRRRHPRAWMGGLVVLVLLTIPYLPILRWLAPLALLERETGYPSYTLAEMALVLLNGWSAGIYQGDFYRSAFTMYAVVLSGALALFGSGWLVVRKRFSVAMALWSWILVPLLAIWLVSMRGPIFTDRYLIWAAPAFYVLMSIGIAALCGVFRWLVPLFLLTVLVIGGVGLYQQAVFSIKPQFEPATRYLEARRTPEELVLFQIPYNVHVMAYYAALPLSPSVDAPHTNWREPDGSYKVGAAYVDREMSLLTSGYDGVWLVYSEVLLWDERELVKVWLDRHGQVTDRQIYAGVELYRYDLNDIN